jgi:hypothetical protein
VKNGYRVTVTMNSLLHLRLAYGRHWKEHRRP